MEIMILLMVYIFATMICIMILPLVNSFSNKIEKYIKEKEEKKNNNIEIKKKKQKILIKDL